MLRQELFQLFDTPITALKLIWVVLIVLGVRLLQRFARAFIFKTLKRYDWFDDDRDKQVFRIVRIVLYLLGAILIINVLHLNASWSEVMAKKLIETHKDGKGSGFAITIGGVLIFFGILIFSRLLIKLLAGALATQLERNKQLDDGQRFTIVKLVRYAAYVMAFLFAANAAGVNLNALLVGSAALLVGVGLALQHVFDDIISGFIILFEGTFQVGDVIESEGMIAKVLHIDIRTSKVLTRDGNVIIVPNRMLSSDKLNNWSHGDELSRFHVTVGVSYSSDVTKVKKLLYQTALAHPDVSRNKPILVRFDDFGDSALVFRVFFWAYRSWDNEVLKSDIRFGIMKAFREGGIEIPFPQRDLHIKGDLGEPRVTVPPVFPRT